MVVIDSNQMLKGSSLSYINGGGYILLRVHLPWFECVTLFL